MLHSVYSLKGHVILQNFSILHVSNKNYDNNIKLKGLTQNKKYNIYIKDGAHLK